MDEKGFEKIQTKPSSLKKNAALLSSQTGQSQFLVGNFSSPLIECMPAEGSNFEMVHYMLKMVHFANHRNMNINFIFK